MRAAAGRKAGRENEIVMIMPPTYAARGTVDQISQERDNTVRREHGLRSEKKKRKYGEEFEYEESSSGREVLIDCLHVFRETIEDTACRS